jgi:hypothetical protein
MEDDRDGRPSPGWLPVLLWTCGAFVLPVLAYLVWTWSLSGIAPAGCVDAAGSACRSPRRDAVAGLLSVLPPLTVALVLALLIASTLRRVAGWRTSTVAFAAAVIGAGITTLAASALG